MPGGSAGGGAGGGGRFAMAEKIEGSMPRAPAPFPGATLGPGACAPTGALPGVGCPPWRRGESAAVCSEQPAESAAEGLLGHEKPRMKKTRAAHQMARRPDTNGMWCVWPNSAWSTPSVGPRRKS